jgi:hypothetical protein
MPKHLQNKLKMPEIQDFGSFFMGQNRPNGAKTSRAAIIAGNF